MCLCCSENACKYRGNAFRPIHFGVTGALSLADGYQISLQYIHVVFEGVVFEIPMVLAGQPVKPNPNICKGSLFAWWL